MFIVYINYINIDIPNCGAKDRVLIKIYYLINITKEKRGSKMQKNLANPNSYRTHYTFTIPAGCDCVICIFCFLTILFKMEKLILKKISISSYLMNQKCSPSFWCKNAKLVK